MIDELVREYRGRTPASAEAHERGGRFLPAGETRSITFYPPYPVVIAEGQGARLRDVDGHEYLDLVNNYTSLVHGTAYPPAMAAAAAVPPAGTAFPSPHERQYALAELLVARIPSVERVRFTNSGSEAGALAARLAQHATGRSRLLMFDGGYHGSLPPLLSDQPGVVTVPYNDLSALDAALTGEVAAVFAEPFLGAGGVVPAEPGFLAGVQELARSCGALFVLDEVQSLRNGVAGEQGRLGLAPDLTMLAKLIGGGFPAGAVGGRADLLDLSASDRAGALPHSGTFNGHLAAMAAGEVTLRDLDEPALARLDQAGAQLADRIAKSGAEAGLPVSVTRAGSILGVHFTDSPPRDAGQVRAAAGPQLAGLHLTLLREGVYTTPRGMVNLSTALTATDLDRVASAYTTAFQRLADGAG